MALFLRCCLVGVATFGVYMGTGYNAYLALAAGAALGVVITSNDGY